MLQRNGFTLVELLIVIVILGILAVVVVFSVSGVTDKGEVSVCATDERTLVTAVEAYFGKYSVQSIAAAVATPEEFETTLVDAGFLRGVSTQWSVDATGQLTAQNPAC